MGIRVLKRLIVDESAQDLAEYGIALAVIGIGAALAAIATGLMDWMDVDTTELSVGLIHGIVNIIGTM